METPETRDLSLVSSFHHRDFNNHERGREAGGYTDRKLNKGVRHGRQIITTGTDKLRLKRVKIIEGSCEGARGEERSK